MAERYKKLREIGSNMWVSDCPVMLYKGVLLHDSQQNMNLLQLGFEAISNKCIAGIEIAYQGFSLGEELIVKGEYSYLDLNLQINEKTGDKSPIYLDDSNARDFHITVKRIFYSDKTTWENDKELQALDRQEELKGRLGDVYEEFRHLYRHQGHGNPMFVPEFEDSYWRCVCGTLNEKDNACRQCSISRNQLDSLLDIDLLRQKKLEREREQKRLAKEEKQRTERKAAEKKMVQKKLRKCLVLLAFIGVLTTLAVLGATKIVLPSMKYQSAVSKLEEGKYDEGLASLRELSGYKGSEKLTKKYALEAVIHDTEKGKYTEALSIADQYHVTDEKAICYLKGLSSIKNNQYSMAFDYLKHCKGYKETDEKFQWLAYTLGCEEMKNGNLNEAYAYLSEIDSAYQDTAKRQTICKKYMQYCKEWKAIYTNFSFKFIIKIVENNKPEMYFISPTNDEEKTPMPKNNKIYWDNDNKSFDFTTGTLCIYTATLNIYRCEVED